MEQETRRKNNYKIKLSPSHKFKAQRIRIWELDGSRRKLLPQINYVETRKKKHSLSNKKRSLKKPIVYFYNFSVIVYKSENEVHPHFCVCVCTELIACMSDTDPAVRPNAARPKKVP